MNSFLFCGCAVISSIARLHRADNLRFGTFDYDYMTNWIHYLCFYRASIESFGGTKCVGRKTESFPVTILFSWHDDGMFPR